MGKAVMPETTLGYNNLTDRKGKARIISLPALAVHPPFETSLLEPKQTDKDSTRKTNGDV